MGTESKIHKSNLVGKPYSASGHETVLPKVITSRTLAWCRTFLHNEETIEKNAQYADSQRLLHRPLELSLGEGRGSSTIKREITRY